MNTQFLIPFIIFAFLIPVMLHQEDVNYQETKAEAYRLADLAYEHMKENMPAGCSFVGDSRYITCLDISIKHRDSLDETIHWCYHFDQDGNCIDDELKGVIIGNTPINTSKSNVGVLHFQVNVVTN